MQQATHIIALSLHLYKLPTRGVNPPGLKGIYNELHENNKKLQKCIASYQSKWATYEPMVKCDGWTDPIRCNIINFLT